MTRRWVEALHHLSFGAAPERCWCDAALRLQGGLSFYLRFGEQVVYGLLQVTASTESARSAATLYAFSRLQHYLVAFGARAPFLIEQATRPMTLLQGAHGVVVSQGAGVYLALADEGHPLPSPAWSVGSVLALRLPLAAPPKAGLVVALGEGASRAMPAELRDAQGMRRTGELWVSEGRVIFAPTITSPPCGGSAVTPLSSVDDAGDPRSPDAATALAHSQDPADARAPPVVVGAPAPVRATAKELRWATVRVRIAALRWPGHGEDARSFSLQLGPSSSGGEPSPWMFLRAGARVGVVSRGPAPSI